jgi:hypothetical protein
MADAGLYPRFARSPGVSSRQSALRHFALCRVTGAVLGAGASFLLLANRNIVSLHGTPGGNTET